MGIELFEKLRDNIIGSRLSGGQAHVYTILRCQTHMMRRSAELGFSGTP